MYCRGLALLVPFAKLCVALHHFRSCLFARCSPDFPFPVPCEWFSRNPHTELLACSRASGKPSRASVPAPLVPGHAQCRI
ncbi:hypothetical protein BKA66DRAFT_453105, partial [Pyrenochaeta sp. MPI-SDFR-AT-0127]